MKKNKWHMIILTLALWPLVITAMFYNQLPEQIPMHWNIQVEIDAWYAKFPELLFYLLL